VGIEKYVPGAWNMGRSLVVVVIVVGVHCWNVSPRSGGQKLGLAVGVLEPRNAPDPGVTLEALEKVGVDVTGENPALVLGEYALLRRDVVHTLV